MSEVRIKNCESRIANCELESIHHRGHGDEPEIINRRSEVGVQMSDVCYQLLTYSRRLRRLCPGTPTNNRIIRRASSPAPHLCWGIRMIPACSSPATRNSVCRRTKSAMLHVTKTMLTDAAKRNCSSSVLCDMPASEVAVTESPLDVSARIRGRDWESSSR